MSIVFLPYHMDEYLPELNVALPAGHELTAVVQELPEGDTWTRLAALYAPTVDLLTPRILAGDRPAVVSADCTAVLATVAALQRAGVQPGIVWFDAHGDLQTLETSHTGYLGGMSVRLLLGYRPELIADRLGLRPVDEDRVVLVDGRDLDPPEAQYLARSAIRRVEVAALAADDLPAGPLLVHVDVDVVDPAEIAELSFPVPGGPTAAAVLAAVGRIRDTGRVAAVSVACAWSPGTADRDGQRARLLRGLLG